jgi:NAD(P)-dependent dehydrogenase (short-subunit alcohol dehydrogenase family)
VETDISSWPSTLNLFKFTYEKYGRIDVVAANAGIHGHERWLEDIMDSDGELEKPDFPAITVNLIGMLYSISPSSQGHLICSFQARSSLFCKEQHSWRSINNNWLSFLIFRYGTLINLCSF